MTTQPWTAHFRRALASPGNLIAGAGAVLASAVLWNPLPLILYGLGEPVWLYRATQSQRFAGQLRDAARQLQLEDGRRALAWREQQLAVLLQTTPCGEWARRGRLPDYAATYVRLSDIRRQAAQIIERRHDTAAVLEQDIVARMDDMLRAYLVMCKERLLFHCSLARIYPQLPDAPAADAPVGLGARLVRLLIAPAPVAAEPLVPWMGDVRFVSLDDARDELRGKLAHFAHESQRDPSLIEVYQPMIDALQHRLAELEARGKNDQTMAAQLRVFPDQFELILHKLATTQADVSEVVSDMKLLLEQTDDTVRFAEDTRIAETPSAISN